MIRSLAVAQVSEKGRELGRGDVGKRPDRELDGELLPVPIDRRQLQPLVENPRLARGQVAAQAIAVGLAQRSGHNQLRHFGADGLLGGVAEDRLCGGIPALHNPIGIHHNDRIGRSLPHGGRRSRACPHSLLIVALAFDERPRCVTLCNRSVPLGHIIRPETEAQAAKLTHVVGLLSRGGLLSSPRPGGCAGPEVVGRLTAGHPLSMDGITDTARFRSDDPDELVSASLACPICLHEDSSSWHSSLIATTPPRAVTVAAANAAGACM